ncbi:MAG: 4Fe-4S binding protein, partial [Bacteroidales bacterium]
MKKSKSENNFLAKLFRSRAFPTVFQIAALIVYLALIWFAVGIDVEKGIKPEISIRNNISSLIIWGIWLPLLIIVTAFFGRLWCAVCPLELVQQMGN